MIAEACGDTGVIRRSPQPETELKVRLGEVALISRTT